MPVISLSNVHFDQLKKWGEYKDSGNCFVSGKDRFRNIRHLTILGLSFHAAKSDNLRVLDLCTSKEPRIAHDFIKYDGHGNVELAVSWPSMAQSLDLVKQFTLDVDDYECGSLKQFEFLKNLECLNIGCLEHFWEPEDFERVLNFNCFKGLIGLDVVRSQSNANVSSFIEQFIALYGRQLRSLHVCRDPDFKQLPHLEELSLRLDDATSPLELSSSIPENCKKLERVHIGYIKSEDFEVNLRKVENIFCIKSIEFISFYVDHKTHGISQNCVIMDTLQLLNNVASKYKKERMKIRLRMNPKGNRNWREKQAEEYDEEHVQAEIFKLTDNLNKNVKNWMFILEDLKGIFDDVGDIKKKWIDLLSPTFCIYSSDGKLVISNKGCNINGIRERWIYCDDSSFCKPYWLL